jgi:hypothetical protein
MDCIHDYRLEADSRASLVVMGLGFYAITADVTWSGAIFKRYPANRAETAGNKSDFFLTEGTKNILRWWIQYFPAGQALRRKDNVTDII